MPLLGSKHTKSSEYFKTLDDLDAWASSPRPKYTTPLAYHARTQQATKATGKLLVCHDYKGGYTESPFALAYTFNYWSFCDTFVYFSHHRVTIPPPGWITAAHRQGVKMLGTLIFEGGAEADCLRLLVGKLPKSKTGPAQSNTSNSLPLSPHYARVLADLAHERGFDGYLLNFECPLQGKIEQTRALCAWITLLQEELRVKVGPHSEVSWYDSVIVDGRLAWQDRLNSINLPFFLSSHNIFSNYTWHSSYPAKTASYFLSLGAETTASSRKTLQDIFMGIDCWGRGSHGGGGFGAFRALTHIAPESLGLSVAFFGQAWTWESEQDKPGWTWEKWWEYERLLWVGRRTIDEAVTIPEMPREKECSCVNDAYKPISSFFGRRAPPDPKVLPMNVAFCPGVGRGWFVKGKKVFDGPWTDVGKQTSMGDLLWPVPSVAWEGDEETVHEFYGMPRIVPSVCMDEAWNGGSSARLEIIDDTTERALYRCIWIPTQSIALSAGTTYRATAIFKLEATAEIDVNLSVKGANTIEVVPTADNDTIMEAGWSKLSVEVTAETECTAAIGLVIAMVCEDPEQTNSSLLLGQLNVSPSHGTHEPSVLWADYDKGVLTWETAISLPPATALTITSLEDPRPAWNIPSMSRWRPEFLYFNIYAVPYQSAVYVGGPEDEGVIWLGTSGLEAQDKAFVVEADNVPFSMSGNVRFFVQGVLDNGEVLPWPRCSYVDKQ
ncbi:glycoside hydrolase family 85 protein [Cylindrobasidium torrendii FP15055 ss-10]|uniref:Glycoside hydrolase family 85 protein n=1 Tax=Cylindrobasidium torrendii FP15055 ss-10 TaxID=1314674 RepID=A0A0D7BPP9_9AGAR|nr:glycoside hydrolase family 85 protein [Cylindrobasidium torrendii FP15055 ss-10]